MVFQAQAGSAAELSDLVEVPARIAEIKNIQQPGFSYNQEHCDMLVREGFRPTDAVYEITFEFQHGCRRKHWMRFNPDLYSLAQHYGSVDSPEKMIGKNVVCIMKGSEFNSEPIQEIKPVRNQN